MLKKISFQTFTDERGSLTPVEITDYVDWPVKRFYYLNDIKKPRGWHSVKGENKFYICMQGWLKCRFHDGEKWEEFELKGPNEAILMEGNYFRDFYEFSSDCVLAALSSVNYNSDDYIYDLEEFIKFKKKE
jgi:dTDP-4-dehydrorhamnose 3,5-epimerase-like enzyme